MALIADDPTDRAMQMLALTETLTQHVEAETRLIDAREPLPEGPMAQEKQRLANAYRLEMARIKQEPSLIDTAPQHLMARLRQATQALQAALNRHTDALAAVKTLSEGLAEVMAQEVHQRRVQARGYGEGGGYRTGLVSGPMAVDRQA